MKVADFIKQEAAKFNTMWIPTVINLFKQNKELHLTPSKGCHFVTRYDGDTLIIREVIYEK